MNFSVKDLMADCGLDSKHVHERTVSRCLNRHGFRFRQARKKGLLNANGERLRSTYPRKRKVVLSKEPQFCTEYLAFYLDGVSFIHKNDPRKAAMQPKSRVWLKTGEGLSITAKGNKSLVGGKRLHVIVAVAWRQGVVLMEDYEKMDGTFLPNLLEIILICVSGRLGLKHMEGDYF